MTDPKALIERLESAGETLRADGCHLEADSCYDAIQALHDLTAENERLQDRANVWQLKAEMAEVKIARLKALGDGLAEYTQHRAGCSAAFGGSCGCGLPAALAAWETRDA